jgi:hypothetical protein
MTEIERLHLRCEDLENDLRKHEALWAECNVNICRRLEKIEDMLSIPEKDAKLIAAAPGLLEFVERLAALIDDEDAGKEPIDEWVLDAIELIDEIKNGKGPGVNTVKGPTTSSMSCICRSEEPKE